MRHLAILLSYKARYGYERVFYFCRRNYGLVFHASQ